MATFVPAHTHIPTTIITTNGGVASKKKFGWAEAAFFAIIIAAIIIIIFVIAAIVVGRRVEDDISSISAAVTGNLPGQTQLNTSSHQVIDYGDDIPTTIPSSDFSRSFALFSGRTVMSTINFALDKPLLLPDDLEIIDTIDNFALFLRRKGTNFFILSFRGTLTTTDVRTDLSENQVMFIDLSGRAYQGAQVHQGFFEQWTAFKPKLNKILDMLGPDDQLNITGHSLGSSLAILTAAGFGLEPNHPQISLYVLAPPRTGNRVFFDLLYGVNNNRWAVINKDDIIPDLPPAVFPSIGNTWLYDQVDRQVRTDIQTGTFQFNHFIDTYICSLERDAIECPSPIIWSSPPRILKPLTREEFS